MVKPALWSSLLKLGCGKRSLLLATLAAALACAAHATPEKAAKYYEDALQRYEKNDLAGATIQLKNTIQEDQKMLAAHLLLGKVLLKSGELKGAEAAFEEALAEGVNRSELTIPLGQLYLMLGEHKKLLDSVTTAGLPESLQAEVLTLRGVAYGMSGSTVLAFKSFSDARAADPRSVSPLLAEAPMLVRAGERDKARALVTKAIELAPDNAAVWYTQGIVLSAMKDLKGAMAAQDRALAINEKFIDARVARVGLLINLGQEKLARDELAKLTSLSLLDPRASYMRGVLASRNGDLTAAKQAFGEAVGLIDSLPPGMLASSEETLMAGALAHQALSDLEKTKTYLGNLLKLNPKHTAGQILLASILLDSKDYGAALPLLEAAQRNEPDDPHVLYLLGRVRLERKQYLQASQLFEQAYARGGEPSVLRDLGVSQLGMGQDQQGLANLEKVYAINPADLEAAIQLAMTYGRLGQSAKALQTAESIVKRDPANLTMLNFLGNVRGRIGDKRGAREAFGQVLAKNPAFRPAAINLNWLDIEEHKFDDARKRLTPMLAQAKDDPELLYQMGVLELRAGRLNESMRHLTHANEVQRSDPRAGFAIIELLNMQKQADKALVAAKSLASAYPANLLVQMALARSYLAVDDKNNARLTLKDATRQAEFDADKQVQIGRLQLLAGGLDDAAYNAQKALQARPDDIEAMILKVEVEARRGDAAQVDAALRALATKHPNSVGSLLTGAHVAMSRRQYAAALAGYRAVMDKQPSTSNAILVVRAYIADGQIDKALPFMQAWVSKQPTDLNARKALAQVQIQVGKPEEARQSYRKILAIEPDDPATLASYAQLLQQLNDPDMVVMARKAVKLAPDNPEFVDLLGSVLVQRGNAEEGLRYLREARLRQPGNGEIRFHLAQALVKTGRRAEAKDELSAALVAPVKARNSPELINLRNLLGL